MRDPFSYIDKVASHGDVVHVNLGGTHVYYLFHPNDIERVLVKNASNYTKGNLMKRSKIVFGNGLILSEGELWKHQRKTMAHPFHPGFIDQLANPVSEIAHEHLKDIDGLRHLDEDFMVLSLEMTMKLLFGNTIGNDLNALAQAFQTIALHFSKIMYQLPVPLGIPIPRNRRYTKP